MTQPIRLGIIGAGFIAGQHLDALGQLTALGSLAGIYSPSRVLKGADGQAVEPQPRCWSESEDDLILSADVDAVVIASPLATHFALTQKAIDAGKPVLCEKPFGVDIVEARTFASMVRAVREHNSTFFPLMPLFHWTEFNLLTRAIKKGRLLRKQLGAFQSASVRYFSGYPTWGNYLDGEASGGGVLDIGIHSVTWLAHTFGDDLASVKATGETGRSGKVDVVDAMLTTKSGQQINLHTGWKDDAAFTIEIVLTFEHGTVEYTCGQTLQIKVGGKPHKHTPKADDLGCYGNQLRSILMSLSSGTPAVVTIDEAMAGMELLNSIMTSVESGGVETAVRLHPAS